MTASEADLLSAELKPSPESLMSFPSFPYTSRKIQEGTAGSQVLGFASPLPPPPTTSSSSHIDPLPSSSATPPSSSYPHYYSSDLYTGYPTTAGGPASMFGSSCSGGGMSGAKGLQPARPRSKVRSNAGKRAPGAGAGVEGACTCGGCLHVWRVCLHAWRVLARVEGACTCGLLARAAACTWCFSLTARVISSVGCLCRTLFPPFLYPWDGTYFCFLTSHVCTTVSAM
jgi:hypothetical protein